jgi:hypothetical protein
MPASPLFQVIFRYGGRTRRVVHQAALHDAEVAGRGAEVAVARAGFEVCGQEADRGVLAATDDFGGRDYAGVAWFLIVVCETCTHSGVRDRGDIGRLGENPIVPHHARRELAHIVQSHFYLGAMRVDLQCLLFEAHLVSGVDVQWTDISHRYSGAEKKEGGAQPFHDLDLILRTKKPEQRVVVGGGAAEYCSRREH